MLRFYHGVCFFPVVLLLDSSSFIATVRIRLTTPIRLLHGLILLPSGISGKMTVTLDLTTIIAMLVCLDAIAMSRFLQLVYQASQIAMTASDLFHPS